MDNLTQAWCTKETYAHDRYSRPVGVRDASETSLLLDSWHKWAPLVNEQRARTSQNPFFL